MRGIRSSAFSCGDRLAACVEATLRARAMRATRTAALRARLNHDRSRLLVRVTRPLLALGCPSLRYGHGLSLGDFRAHAHAPWFRLAPHFGHSPLHAGRQSTRAGTSSNHSCRTAGRRSISDPLRPFDMGSTSGSSSSTADSSAKSTCVSVSTIASTCTRQRLQSSVTDPLSVPLK